MAKTLTLLIVLFPTFLSAQNINDSLLTTFYNKTIAHYFSETSLGDRTKFDYILLRTNFDTTGLIKYSGLNKFKYFDSLTAIHSMLDKPFKSNNGRSIYWVDHKIIQQDTVDINIGGWTIENVSRKRITIGAWCGGAMGYIPKGRFIFDKAKNTWTFVSGQAIIDQ